MGRRAHGPHWEAKEENMTTYEVLVTRRYIVRVSDPKFLPRAMDDIRAGQTLAETYTGGGSFSVTAGKTVVKVGNPRRRA